MTRAEIFTAITAERARQDEKHPVAFSCLLGEADLDKERLDAYTLLLKGVNNSLESKGRHTAYGIVQEEVCEFFAETDKVRQVEEAIQNAALWVRIIEEITK